MLVVAPFKWVTPWMDGWAADVGAHLAFGVACCKGLRHGYARLNRLRHEWRVNAEVGMHLAFGIA